MKTTIVAVTCALCVAACANNKPAQDQSSAANETPPGTETSSATGATTTQPGTMGNPSGATSMMGNGANSSANPGSTYPGGSSTMGNTGSNTGNMGNTGYGSANPGAMGNTGSTTPGSTGSSNTGTSNTPGSSTGQGSTSSQGTMNQGTPGQGMTNQGSTNQGSAADTTGQNAGSATSTPVQQGNSKAELAITASIHRDLARSRSLSATAKTVKVITYGTTVTLRGPVSSDTDRTTIENLARQTPGVTDVDDQLVVKGNTK